MVGRCALLRTDDATDGRVILRATPTPLRPFSQLVPTTARKAAEGDQAYERDDDPPEKTPEDRDHDPDDDDDPAEG